MKKVFAVILLLALLTPLISYAANTKLYGSWVSCGEGNMFVFTFNKNKKGSYTIIYNFTSSNSSIATMQGTWSLKGNNVSLKIKQGKLNMDGLILVIDAQTMQFTFKNGTLMNKTSKEYLVKVSE